MLWLIEGSKSVEALMLTLTWPTYLSKCFWYYDHHHRHHHRRHHHHRHITIAVITISQGPNAHTYAHNQWEAGNRFRWKIWVRDLLSPRSNCLPFLQNLRLQLSTPWLWVIEISRRSGRTKNTAQTKIWTDLMISATATRLPLSISCHPLPGAYRLQLSKSLDRATRSIHGSI